MHRRTGRQLVRSGPAGRLAGQGPAEFVPLDLLPATPTWLGRSPRPGVRGPQCPRLSTIRTYCPVRTIEPSDTALLSHLAGSSASKQTYC